MSQRDTIIAIGICLSGLSASAQTWQDQAELQRSDQMTIESLVDDVLERYPVYEELPARLEEAAKFDDQASSLFSNSPSFVLRYQTGQLSNFEKLREYEAGLTLPLWRFGERKASQQVARDMELEASAFAALIRWELAGALRISLWRVELTADRVAKTEKAVAFSTELLRGIQRRVDLGVLPPSDLLQAKEDKLNNDIRLSAAHVEQANAIRAYQIITEQSLAPASIIENRSMKTGVDEQHPALIHSTARLGRAAAEYRLQQERSGNNRPNVMLGVRSERGGADSNFEDSVGFVFTYPLGFGSHVNAQQAAAGVRAAGVRAEHRTRRRQLEIMAHDTERNLTGAKREHRLAEQKNELAQQHLAMSTKAFELGEIELLIFLIIKERAYAAEMDASQKEIQWRSAIAAYNQAVGEMP